jgi:hypothetical protein
VLIIALASIAQATVNTIMYRLWTATVDKPVRETWGQGGKAPGPRGKLWQLLAGDPGRCTSPLSYGISCSKRVSNQNPPRGPGAAPPPTPHATQPSCLTDRFVKTLIARTETLHDDCPPERCAEWNNTRVATNMSTATTPETRSNHI